MNEATDAFSMFAPRKRYGQHLAKWSEGLFGPRSATSSALGQMLRSVLESVPGTLAVSPADPARTMFVYDTEASTSR
jgi:hypothetical protein